MCLAIGGKSGKKTMVYAGVNSSPAEISKGTNQHLRAFAIGSSKSRSTAGTTTTDVSVAEESRTALFTKPESATYQRLVRVAESGVGVAASAFASNPEVVVFDTKGSKQPTIKCVLDMPRDAEAIDIIQSAPDEHLLVYCLRYDLYLVKLSNKGQGEPQLIFTMPEGEPVRPAFKTLRFLSPKFLLGLANFPGRPGALLQGFRLPTPGHEKARLAVTASIKRKMMPTSLAVTNLTPPEKSYSALGDTQFLVAVGGQDSSISLFTLEHKASPAIDLLYNLYPLHTLKNVHEEANISGLAFSKFVTPKTHIRPQFIKLASISLQSTVAVHSIPLKKFVDSTPREPKSPPRQPRYVSAMKSTGPGKARRALTLVSIMVLILALAGQAVMEAYGASNLKLFPFIHGSLSLKNDPVYIAQVKMRDEFLANIVGTEQQPLQNGQKLVIRATKQDPPAPVEGQDEDNLDPALDSPSHKIELDVHDHEIHGPGHKWDDLPAHKQYEWKQRLYDAGAWTQQMGENVFQGILFGEMAGAVNHAVNN